MCSIYYIGLFEWLSLYPSYFKLHVCWLLLLLVPFMGLASTRLLQVAFKSALGAECQ
ncbi:hypothetical protein DJ55_4153 [Yersinia pseudotuberculosis]|nr:hypothetical protein DJ55_4153 [Yersinia pseudotuberculosis]